MSLKQFRVGNWYDSQRDLRVPIRNPAKGIASWKGVVYIIVTYHGSRRAPYEDRLDLQHGTLSYVGHGRTGDQREDFWNALLINACREQTVVRAFLDCGDLFRPKQLLYAGEWHVAEWRTRREAGRKVFRFLLRPASSESLQQLRDVVLYPAGNVAFERALRRFGRERQQFYARFPNVLRSKDNLAGSVGEYWAIAAFNRQCEGRPLIRCSTSFRDIDAIQSGTNNGFAIKTVTRFPASSSSIWSSEFAKSGRQPIAPKQGSRNGPTATINNFLIAVLDDALQPRFIGHIAAKVAEQFARRDAYQGSNKLHICQELVKHPDMRLLVGDSSRLCP